MRKKILEKRQQRLQKRRQDLVQRAQASQDAAEVRSINAQIQEINEDLDDIREELDAIEAEERAAQPAQAGDPIPANAPEMNGNVRGAFQVGSQGTRTEDRSENVLESMEYRNAFRNYVVSGTPIPAELRAGDAISTADTGVMIPMTIMNEVINTVRNRYGNLYSKVRKISVQGGVEYPIGALRAKFRWINESTVSPRQKLDKLGKVSFGYNTAEIRISQTFLSRIVTLSAFEAEISRVIAIAYLEAMDYGIVNGSGDASMLGILNDPRVTKTVTMTAADMSNWTKWRKNFFSQLPLGYRSGEFMFPVSTVDSYLETMADSNNNPIFRQTADLVVNDGDSRNPNGRFFGREISLVEEDIIPDFDTASAGDVIGIYWQPEEYAINENFGFTMRRYFDEETNEWVDKALVVVDGKVLNPTGYVKLIKG